jgi:Zn-dependent protease with chaperone function
VIVACSLLAYATLVALGGQVALARLTRSGTAPRLGILAWYVAALTAVSSWAIGAMAIADPDPLHGLAHFLTAGVTAVHEGTGVHHVTAPGASWLRIAAVVLAVGIVYRAGYCIARDAWVARRRRLRHAAVLALVARPLSGRDVLVLDQSTPLAYCLPSRSRMIVVTDGAVRALSPPQLDAVLEHERAHLSGRHHLVRASLGSLASAFPGIPVLAQASREVLPLLEMCADDAAVRRHGSAAVTGALQSLSSAPTPQETFAAGSISAQERITRLCRPAEGRSRKRGGLVAAVAVLVTGPIASVAIPILFAASSTG